MKNNKRHIDEIKEAVESTSRSLSPAIAASTVASRLDAHYIVLRRSELPEVTKSSFGGNEIATSELSVRKDMDPEKAIDRAKQYLALAAKLQQIKEEEGKRTAALKAHRERVHKRLYPNNIDVGYDQSLTCVKIAIDEIVKLETEIDLKKNRL